MADESRVPQGFAVLCYFDKNSEEMLQSLLRKHNTELGYSAGMCEVNARPHVTLASYGASCGVPDVAETIKELALKTKPFSIEFNGVGSFSGAEGVVFLSPVHNKSLLDIHMEYHAASGCFEGESLYTCVGKWTPHCTVGFRLSSDRLALTKDFFYKHLEKIGTVRIESIAIISFHPHHVLDNFALNTSLRDVC